MSENNFAPPSNTPPAIPENFKETLVGPEAKYKTEDEALKALFHSQAHIAKLESEAAAREAEYQAKLAGSKTVEEVLAAIDAKKEQTHIVPPEGLTPPVVPTAPVEAPKQEDIEALIRKYVEDTHSERTKEANFNRAVTALDGKFGSRDATNQAVAAKAAELGVGVPFLIDMANQSPEGFLKVMDASSSTIPKTEPIPQGINTSSLLKHAPRGGPAPQGTYRWYQELKASKPSEYRKLYSKQMEDMAADPDKFYERT